MIDGENIPNKEIAVAAAVGAKACLSSSPLYPASLWSGLADDIISWYGYDCYPMMRCPASFSNFRYSTDLRLIFVYFFAYSPSP